MKDRQFTRTKGILMTLNCHPDAIKMMQMQKKLRIFRRPETLADWLSRLHLAKSISLVLLR